MGVTLTIPGNFHCLFVIKTLLIHCCSSFRCSTFHSVKWLNLFNLLFYCAVVAFVGSDVFMVFWCSLIHCCCSFVFAFCSSKFIVLFIVITTLMNFLLFIHWCLLFISMPFHSKLITVLCFFIVVFIFVSVVTFMLFLFINSFLFFCSILVFIHSFIRFHSVVLCSLFV